MASPFGRVGQNQNQGELCERCHCGHVVHLRSMMRYSELDWFKCDGCEHLFTRPRAAANATRDDALGSSGSATGYQAT
jgi:hypothetical protein